MRPLHYLPEPIAVGVAPGRGYGIVVVYDMLLKVGLIYSAGSKSAVIFASEHRHMGEFLPEIIEGMGDIVKAGDVQDIGGSIV